MLHSFSSQYRLSNKLLRILHFLDTIHGIFSVAMDVLAYTAGKM